MDTKVVVWYRNYVDNQKNHSPAIFNVVYRPQYMDDPNPVFFVYASTVPNSARKQINAFILAEVFPELLKGMRAVLGSQVSCNWSLIYCNQAMIFEYNGKVVWRKPYEQLVWR